MLKATQETTDTGLFFVREGAEFAYNEWHKGEIIVERRGLLRPNYVFLHNKEQIAVLYWKRARFGIYESMGLREAKIIKLELHVDAMAKTFFAKDDFSRVSRLTIKSSRNPRKPSMLIQLADSDGFLVHRYCNDFPCCDFSLHVTKQHYVTDLVRFDIKTSNKKSRAVARINVPPLMRWEAHHFHQLLALVTGYISFMHGRRNKRRLKSGTPNERASISRNK